jgi:hypothetical protein
MAESLCIRHGPVILDPTKQTASGGGRVVPVGRENQGQPI